LTVTIENQTGQIQVDIINSIGQNVFTEARLFSKSESFDIENQQPGIYFINVKCQDKSFSRKLVIQ